MHTDVPLCGAPRQVCIAALHTRLQRLAKAADDYRDLTGVTWAPRVGAYLCAAHFLEHHLQDSPVALLLMTEQVRTPRVQFAIHLPVCYLYACMRGGVGEFEVFMWILMRISESRIVEG